MGRVYYNKLIRDSILDKIIKKGESCESYEVSDEQEFEQELLKKVSEEAMALSRVRSRKDFLDELADLLIVLETLYKVEGISAKEIEEAKIDNLKRKGGFTKRLFLKWSDDSGYVSNETGQGIKK